MFHSILDVFGTKNVYQKLGILDSPPYLGNYPSILPTCFSASLRWSCSRKSGILGLQKGRQEEVFATPLNNSSSNRWRLKKDEFPRCMMDGNRFQQRCNLFLSDPVFLQWNYNHQTLSREKRNTKVLGENGFHGCDVFLCNLSSCSLNGASSQ